MSRSPIKMMQEEGAVLVRVHDAGEEAWQELKARATTPDPEFGMPPRLEFQDRFELEGASPAELRGLVDPSNWISGVFVADTRTFSEEEMTLLVIQPVHPEEVDEPDEEDDRIWSMRIAPRFVASVEANLTVGNVDIDEFAQELDEDGVFRGV